MKNDKENIELTKKIYLEISKDKTTQIANLKQDVNDKAGEIEGRISYLKELREALKIVRNRIRLERRALFRNIMERFSIKRELSRQNRYATKINTDYSKGKESVRINNYYSSNEKKAR